MVRLEFLLCFTSGFAIHRGCRPLSKNHIYFTTFNFSRRTILGKEMQRAAMKMDICCIMLMACCAADAESSFANETHLKIGSHDITETHPVREP